MKKPTALLVTSACALTITSNSFGMLTKVSSLKQIKQIRSASYGASIEAHYKAQEREALIKTDANNKLLHKIIQQNEDNNNLLKENNLLLRTIAKQNYAYGYKHTFANKQQIHNFFNRGGHENRYIPMHEDLLEHYSTLKKQYDIDIAYLLE